ncbi:hypothetical protein V6N13_079972 [Hibiscus sabdariffa]
MLRDEIGWSVRDECMCIVNFWQPQGSAPWFSSINWIIFPMPCPVMSFVTHHGQQDVAALMQVLSEDCVQHILMVLPLSAGLFSLKRRC